MKIEKRECKENKEKIHLQYFIVFIKKSTLSGPTHFKFLLRLNCISKFEKDNVYMVKDMIQEQLCSCRNREKSLLHCMFHYAQFVPYSVYNLKDKISASLNYSMITFNMLYNGEACFGGKIFEVKHSNQSRKFYQHFSKSCIVIKE